MSEKRGLSIRIQGIVQGVGFRPFVYRLASRYGLTGWVRNTTRGVEIEVDGKPDHLSSFLQALTDEPPPLSKIESVRSDAKEVNGFSEFKIVPSRGDSGGFQPLSPDVGVCEDCLQELFDPADHRYRYPFINCTNCGPRFTIIKDIPYDRPKTTMAGFEMCPVCAGEYQDPLDRRFHAQPVACPDCGPQIWITGNHPSPAPSLLGAQITADRAMVETQHELAAGKIVAIKGLGGFHLACDAANDTAVNTLRERKHRPSKPLAVMMPDLDTVSRYCRVREEERELLESPQRPIVLLEKRDNPDLSPAVAPGQSTLGIMLPYTPLHYLLFATGDHYPRAPYEVLVMTSGNRSHQPIITRNQEAIRDLAPIADSFLLHNRGIHVRCDDSVSRLAGSHSYPIRRARGYVPFPVKLPTSGPPLLAAGADLKNTFCGVKGNQAYLSQHIGDLENYQTLEAYRESLAHFENLFRLQPEVLAYDLHPDYLASRYTLDRANEENIPTVGVQHHFAHIASCLAENGFHGKEPVIGCAFDGTGYGDDGHIWGGEFLIADYRGYHRAYHLRYAPLPGGEQAIREPWRFALAWLHQLGLEWEPSLPPVRFAGERDRFKGVNPLSVLQRQLETGTNAPLTSSMGRLFDAVSSLIGLRHRVDYEAQAAIELEAMARPGQEVAYPLDLDNGLLDPAPLFSRIVGDLQRETPPGVIAARFHNGLAAAVVAVCQQLGEEHQIDKVALSGGVWQNILLLERTRALLENAGFTVYIHRTVPANDGGVSLGQAVIAQQVTQR